MESGGGFELLQALRNAGATDHDQRVAAEHRFIRIGVVDGGAVLPFDGDDNGVGSLADGGVAERRIARWRIRFHDLFVHLQLDPLAGELDELDYVGPGEEVGDLVGPYDLGADDFGGPGPHEFRLGSWLFGAGDDGHVGS